MKIQFCALLLLSAWHVSGSRTKRQDNNGEKPSGIVDPSTISDCTWWVNFQAGENCQAILDYFGLEQAKFLAYNPIIEAGCTGLQAGHSYCVEENYGLGPVPKTSTQKPSSTTASSTTSPSPTGQSPVQSGVAKDCTRWYKVVSGDTCDAIVDKYKTFTLGDFYKWNPAVGTTCKNLQPDYFVCVGVPGTPTSSITPTSTPKGPQPQQPGLISTCNKYYLVISGDYCNAIAQQYGITTEQFIAWNPAAKSDCSGLQPNYYVCVGIEAATTTKKPSTTVSTSIRTSSVSARPSPTQSGIISTCTSYYKAKSGDSCWAIANTYGTFTSDQFIAWNPAVKSDCSGLLPDYYYCVAAPGTKTTSSPSPTPTTPQPQQPGTIATCKKYYFVKSGDYCYAIQQSQNVTAANFAKWNPGIKSDCSNLQPNVYICIGA